MAGRVKGVCRMPSISKRGQSMPASPIRRLVPYADAAKAKGIHVHHLNIGQPDIATPKEMIAAYQSYDDQVLAYGPSAGLQEEYFKGRANCRGPVIVST